MHIDWWTLALQAINVLILVWILGRFFFRPVAGIIEARSAAAARIVADASADRAAAQAEKAQLEAARAGLAGERDALLADARARIESERSAMLRDAASRIEVQRSEGEAQLARERNATEHALADDAGKLAAEIAGKLLQRVAAESVDTSFFGGLLAELDALPQTARQAFAATIRDAELHVRTASPLGESGRSAIADGIEKTFDIRPRIAFECDAQLIAGVELRAGAFVFRNNWQSDLAQILERLRRDDERG